MRHPLIVLVLGISLSLVGFAWVPPAQAASAHISAAQGRAKKKPRKKKAAKPRTDKTVAAKSKKPPKNDIGFAL